eukprot:240367-Chlamydomonas_euryale.AAC.1
MKLNSEEPDTRTRGPPSLNFHITLSTNPLHSYHSFPPAVQCTHPTLHHHPPCHSLSLPGARIPQPDPNPNPNRCTYACAPRPQDQQQHVLVGGVAADVAPGKVWRRPEHAAAHGRCSARAVWLVGAVEKVRGRCGASRG